MDKEVIECIFCRLISENKLDGRTILKNDKYIAFLDSKPLVEGHTLVIPIEHKTWVWDVTDYTEYQDFTKQVANQLRQKLGVEKIDTLISGGSVPHAHIHLLPSTPSKWGDVKEFLRKLRKEVVSPPSDETHKKIKA